MKKLELKVYTKKDLATAKKYWSNFFSQHKQQLPPKQPNCQLSIIIPVFNEKIERLRDQLKSFTNQTLDKNKFEVIYIVNNGFPDNSSNWKIANKANIQTINFLKKYKKLNIHIIDRSSAGKEILNCNVGKARNVGVAETSRRYFEQNQDGILFQTDADTRLNNQEQLRNIITAFQKNPRAFGAAGGVIYEINPDTENLKEKKTYIRSLKIIRMYFQWQTLLFEQFKKNPVPPVYPTRFSGMHMISKAIASACINGVPEQGYAEDTIFGQALETFAKKHFGYILPKRQKWYVVSALRESLRTEASYGNILNRIISDETVFVYSEKAPYFQFFYKQRLLELKKTKSLKEFRLLLNNKQTTYNFSDQNLLELKKALTQQNNAVNLYAAYKKWRNSLLGNKRGPMEMLYIEKYPMVKLTKFRLEQLKKRLHKDPKKLQHFQNVNKNYYNFRLPKKI